MIVLAVDTATVSGSAAIVRRGEVLVERAGDGRRTHGERLPRELMEVLEAARLSLDEVEAYAVAVGPGSFTGLRVGIATIQGLALVRGARVYPVSNFEALAFRTPPSADPLGVWIDAHRGEVFATLLDADRRRVLEPPTSLTPAATLDRWGASLEDLAPVRFVGDGARRYADVLSARLGGRATIESTVPLLAGAIGRIASAEPARAVAPHAVVPLYVRRPDAELARDRRRQAEEPH